MAPQRILYINGGIMHRGGIESYMMNYYRYFDRDKLQVDFIVHGFEKGVYDDEILSLGGKIYQVAVKSKTPLKNSLQIREIFKNHPYKIVHSHMDAMSYVPLKIAKQCNIPVRIAHSHNTQHLTNNWFKYQLNEQARKKLPKVATHLFACSKEAGIWLFGKENESRFQIIPNAIETNKFKFSKKLRVNIRKQLHISEEAIVLGHIGRFDYQKNHLFLLEMFADLYKENKKFCLVMIGDGILKAQMQNRVKELLISESVIFVDACPNANEYYNAFDLFLLPSHFEGLGIVLIEAQTNGLKCLASTNVPTTSNLTGNVKFLPLDKGIWVKAIMNSSIQRSENALAEVRLAGYEIEEQAMHLQKQYEELLSR